MASTRVRPARGPSRIATATARFSSTTDDGFDRLAHRFGRALAHQWYPPLTSATAFELASPALKSMPMIMLKTEISDRDLLFRSPTRESV